MTAAWRQGNTVRLLENGEEFFPRVFEALRAARREILLETFILFDDKVGQELRAVLIEAAGRGVEVDVTVDGYGSDCLDDAFIGGLAKAGVRFHIFDPQPRVFGFRVNALRRMHRKIVVVDGQTAFVGGINFSADHLTEFGPTAKQDYAVELQGPVVEDIRRFAQAAVRGGRRQRWPARRGPAHGARGQGSALFVTRDNDRHSTDIERYYRAGFRTAQQDIIIANAYFFPGYRLLRDLRNAARRGVRVRLILQGEPDMPIAQLAARTLYDYLMSAGVTIYEYCERPLHGKVACVDDEWATVGSSNLDPLSLALNLEANVIVRDRAFTAELRDSLETLIERHCRQIVPKHGFKRVLRRLWFGVAVFHVLHRFPAWAGSLPARPARLQRVDPAQPAMDTEEPRHD
ncbi:MULTISPECIES: cardiolipin synthase ClsB [Bordetella]|uniref:Cardiolipin synthase B n=2 Tax=Bordetella TaxID=517 RepID=A0A261VNQ3_9BORD|nr:MULTISPECIES: cardiolipin synthase ClsB [Bordetella]MDM9557703.1 cardiolipin synthase ClsB [Bordetella petrii]OZI75754.1 cardiolipin synthase B [Bordetella genomosp. 2]